MPQKKKAKAAKESRRFGTLVRMADDVVVDAKAVASLLGVSMAEYLSDRLRPIVKQDLADQTKKRLER